MLVISNAALFFLAMVLIFWFLAKGLAPAEHRIMLCQLATGDSSFIMVDPWEVRMLSAFPYCLLFLYESFHSMRFFNNPDQNPLRLCNKVAEVSWVNGMGEVGEAG